MFKESGQVFNLQNFVPEKDLSLILDDSVEWKDKGWILNNLDAICLEYFLDHSSIYKKQKLA